MEPRKASDVLLELESKIDTLMSIVRTQDLNIKILSNKLNTLIEKSDKLPIPGAVVSTPRIEAVTSPPQVILSEEPLPIEKEPNGFRRTSRPETYAKNEVKPAIQTVTPKFPMQIPKLNNTAEIIVNKPDTEIKPLDKNNESKVAPPQNTIPIQQRIVDKNGKSMFMADVEIIDTETKQTFSKIKTSAVGKWMASLPIGKYKVFIRKRESINKEMMEIIQDINVDGSKSPLELPMAIIK